MVVKIIERQREEMVGRELSTPESRRERAEEKFWPGGRTGGEDEGRRKEEPRNTHQ